ncbi:MAG: hypothetical protein NT155_01460 [Candidatus Staskawiczbacteria bacterium]|nr:hypothetical protein [Candidatus Staskawiczbacteria bacterium]
MTKGFPMNKLNAIFDKMARAIAPFSWPLAIICSLLTFAYQSTKLHNSPTFTAVFAGVFLSCSIFLWAEFWIRRNRLYPLAGLCSSIWLLMSTMLFIKLIELL